MKASFSNLNKKIIGKASRRFWGRLEAVVEADDGIFAWTQFIVFQDIFMQF